MPQDFYESRNIKEAVKALQDAYPEIVGYYERKNPGLTLNLSCVYRTPERQFELFKQGRSNKGTLAQPDWQVIEPAKIVTNCDGFIKISKHNEYPSKALDFFVVDNKTKKAIWIREFYKDIGPIAKTCGLVWGGDWAMDDYPHVEIGKNTYGSNSSKHIHGFVPPRLPTLEDEEGLL
jgi:hypothetical protein